MLRALVRSAALMPPGNCVLFIVTLDGAAELNPKVTCGNCPA